MQHPWLPRFGSAGGTALVLALALAASFALGLRARRAGPALRRAAILLDVVLLVAAVPVLEHAADAPPVAPLERGGRADAAARRGATTASPVENIYPYGRKGRLLHDVRLYDQLGRPLDVPIGSRRPGAPGARARRRAALNAFPIRYFEPGTRRVARPNAGPPIDPPAAEDAAARSTQRRRSDAASVASAPAEQDEAAGPVPPAGAGGVEREPGEQRQRDAERQRPGLAEHELAQLRDHAGASRASVATWSWEAATSAAAT